MIMRRKIEKKITVKEYIDTYMKERGQQSAAAKNKILKIIYVNKDIFYN